MSENDYPQDRGPMTPFEWTGHNDLCAKWVRDHGNTWYLEKDIACSCGGTELPAHLKTIADIELAREMQEK